MIRVTLYTDDDRRVTIHACDGILKTFDNSWAVLYSQILCKLFNAHINIEACKSVRVIKYICKYINKGSGQVIFNLCNKGTVLMK